MVEFEEKFVKKIDKGLKQDATKRELAEARKGETHNDVTVFSNSEGLVKMYIFCCSQQRTHSAR